MASRGLLASLSSVTSAQGLTIVRSKRNSHPLGIHIHRRGRYARWHRPCVVGRTCVLPGHLARRVFYPPCRTPSCIPGGTRTLGGEASGYELIYSTPTSDTKACAAKLSVHGSPSCGVALRLDRVGCGRQTPPKGLASKSRLHCVERFQLLAIHKHCSGPFLSPREADVGSPGSATVLLKEVPAEVFSVVGVKNSGDFGLDMRDQPEATLFVE